MTSPVARTGGRLLVDMLLAHGVERITCVPGESYLAVLDALHDADLDVIVCRQEGGAAMMAEAYGKLTGRPGVCMVTRAPGATNASAGVHVAMQDSTPMLLLVGDVARGMRGREAFQEVDFQAMFGPLAKAVIEIDAAARIPELLAKAFRIATQGRPGPVVVTLPEDMLTETAAVVIGPVGPSAQAWPEPAALARAEALLASAERPLVIVGGSTWDEASAAMLPAWAERLGLPVATSFRRTHLMAPGHPHYVGDVGLPANPALAARVRDADVILLLGGRLSETPSAGYSLMAVPYPGQSLIHVHPAMEELGRVYQPEVAINASAAAFMTAAAGFADTRSSERALRVAQARAEFEEWTGAPAPVPGDFQYGAVVRWLSDRLPHDAIVANGAGNFAIWLPRYFRYRGFRSQLAPTSGSMGYGVPAAIMAKRQHPDRVVVAFAGDGDVLMTGQELATAVQYGVAVIILVIDNGMYGTIRMHQERRYPGRVSATRLDNPDFAAVARAFGGHGERVEGTADFAPAFERALHSGRPAILHCLIDPEALTPDRSLSQIRGAGG